MTEYERYLLDKLHKLKEENHSLESELVNTKKLVVKESRESASLRKLNHELSERINFLNSKEEELRRENEELKLKAEEYYGSWQDELMQRDDYEDI